MNLTKKIYRFITPEWFRAWVRKVRSFQILTFKYYGQPTTKEDGMITFTNSDFLSDELFRQSYALGKATNSWGEGEIHWRAYVACWAASHARLLEGDFVECGVNKGGMSRMIMNYIDFGKMPDRAFYLLDTFNGLVEKYISDEEKELGIKPGGYEECYDVVNNTFKSFPNVRIIQGPVPDTLPQVEAEKVCYLSLDMNCAPPEVAAAEYFWDRMVSGGIMLLDDYGWVHRLVQKKAMDDFASRKGVRVLSLPTGQGMIIKP